MVTRQNNNLNKSLKSRLTSKERITLSCETIEKYASFEENMIGRAIARLMQAYEGERYVYHILYADIKYLNNKPTLKRYLKAVMPEEDISFVSTKTLKNKTELMDNSDKNFILARGIVSTKETTPVNSRIAFYKFNEKTNSLNLTTNFKRVPYVLEFINKLIIYKMEYGKIDLTETELENLLIAFLDEKRENLENHQMKQLKKSRI